MSNQDSGQDEEFRELMRRFDEAGGRQAPPQPGFTAMPPQQQQPQRVALELFPARAMWVLLALNIAIFIVPEVLGLSDVVAQWGMKENGAIKAGEYYRLLTAMFLHSGLTHIAFNAFALYSIGRDVERLYGTARFLAIYFLAGLGGGLLSYALSPNPSVGASGAIFGLIGALGAFFYSTRRIFGELSRQQLGSLMFITLINFGIGLTTPRIDNFAHLGGLVVGAATGLLLAPQLAVDARRVPPAIMRRGRPYGWPGAAALLALLIAAALLINPPLG
jgi:rhomboid protease GluP